LLFRSLRFQRAHGGVHKIIEGKLRGENNIRVINNSWGLTDQNVIVFKEIRDMLKQFKQVVDMAEKAGIQMVFAAGNEGEAIGIPKLGTLSLFGMDIDKMTAEEKTDLDYILDKVILVGASNTEGVEDRSRHKVGGFSSIGDSLNSKMKPTVVAPGVDMMVYSWKDKGGNPKELVNGTSFASPYVAGLVTLLVQANPKLIPAEIRDILKKTAVKLKDVPETYQGHGEVSPDAAVVMAKDYGMKASVTEPLPKPDSGAKTPIPGKPSAPPAKSDDDQDQKAPAA